VGAPGNSWHAAAMADVDLVDETFIAVARPFVAARLTEDQWKRWWPDLELTVFMDRGDAGIRWSMTGTMVGSCEIWLEEVLDGTLVHYYLRGAPSDSTGRVAQPFPDDPSGWRAASRLRTKHAKQWKAHVWQLKDDLENNRRPGAPGVSG